MHEDPPVLPLEVLELILLQLDLRTLLVAATCVCHAWAELIRDSPAIQRRLFFAPDPDIQPSAPIHCALLADAFPSVFVYHRTGAFWEDDLGDPTRQFSVKSWDLILHPNRQPAYLRPEASWRRMLVQQPPIYKLGVWFEQYSPHVSAQEYHEIPGDPGLAPDGIRMETLFDAILFDPDLYWDSLRLIWHGHCSASALKKLTELENFRGRKLSVDLILNSATASEDYIRGSDEEEEDEEEPTPEHTALTSIRAEYEKLGWTPQVGAKGWRTKGNWYDVNL